ncbi:SMP-30/gluconolactonase/LRE family protein [Roseibium litorale]|uniref:SMP-30/gluconolactonase/LRE family protein n=1 Tax=Roseibium litorale TaxID=2803841 RepID=A0ABR9CGL9_9HYPH|nr:SMP-30/gluconolactonase/LRE family protein [Roseibium litorale]MBD8890031.1 SMP-30/gluconolactonase/LRE family protein [Roseibium litorale]
MTSQIFDGRRCELGEGPLWHPLRKELFWFDILGKRLLWRGEKGAGERSFDAYVSAAGWVDENRLLIASARALFVHDLRDGSSETLCLLEADNEITRSNDGRADPWGGFWIGTMGVKSEDKAGAIYRWYRGELRKIVADVTISNSICFSPDRQFAYYTDTRDARLLKVRLDAETGWFAGEPEVFLDARGESWGIDGSVVDAKGNLWNAQWGASRVSCYAPDGKLLASHPVAGLQASCPAFGGPDFSRLFVTTAATGLSADALSEEPGNGLTHVIEGAGQGLAEYQVIL